MPPRHLHGVSLIVGGRRDDDFDAKKGELDRATNLLVTASARKLPDDVEGELFDDRRIKQSVVLVTDDDPL